MKKILLILTILVFKLTPSVCQCNTFDCAYQTSVKLLQSANKDKYKKALANLDDADNYAVNKAEKDKVKNLRDRIFDAIENEKEDAIKARDESKEQSERAENAIIEAKKREKEAIAGKLASNARAVLATEKDFITALRIADAATKVTETPTEEAISSLNDIVSDMSLITHQSSFNCIKRFGHSTVNSITFTKISQDGNLLATISEEDSTIRLWNTKIGKNYLVLKQDMPMIYDVVISADNRQLLVVNGNGIIRSWNTLTGYQSINYNDTSAVSKVFFYNDKPMLVQYRDSIIRVIDLVSGSVLKNLIGISLPIESFYTSSTGRFIAGYAQKDNKLGIWDLEGSSTMYEVNYGDLNGFTYFAFSPNSKYFALGKYKIIQLYDLNTKKLLANFTGHKNNVASIGFSDDGKYLISSEEYTNIKLWNISWKQNIQNINTSMSKKPTFAISKDNRFIINYAQDGVVKIWRTIDDFLDKEKSATFNEEQRKGFGIPDWIKD